jgi:predicted nucleic acid-binding protein
VILVDTSVWIELINGRLGRTLTADRLLAFVTCGPIVQEVLQGLRQASASDPFREGFLAIPCLSDPLPCGAFLQAADIYRQGRQKGFTIRSSADCLIAAIAIENKVPVWHRGRDFDAIARYTALHASQHLERLTAELR